MERSELVAIYKDLIKQRFQLRAVMEIKEFELREIENKLHSNQFYPMNPREY